MLGQRADTSVIHSSDAGRAALLGRQPELHDRSPAPGRSPHRGRAETPIQMVAVKPIPTICGSPAPYVARRLLDSDHLVSAFDPAVSRESGERAAPGIRMTDTAEEVFDRAEA